MLNPHGRPFRVLLGAQSMVSSLAVDMSLPALPAIAAAFGTDAARAQLTIGFYLLGYASGQLFYGPLSDRFGRRPILLIGMTIYALSGFLCAVAPSIDAMIALRLLQGFGGAAGVVVTRAAARDHFGGRDLAQMMSSITAVQAFGPLLAPVIGGVLATHFRWETIFYVQGTFAAAMLLSTWAGFPESLKTRDLHAIRPGRLLTNYWTFFSHPRCIGFALVSACVFGGLFIVLSASPFVLIDVYGVSSQAYGFFFGTSVLGYMVGSFANRRLLGRGVASEGLLRTGLVLLIVAAGAMLILAAEMWGGIAGVMVPYVSYCFAISFVQPNAIAAAMEPVPHMAGTGASLMGAIQMASAAAGGFIVDLFFDGTGTPMGIGMASAAITASLFYWAIARRHKRGP
ncbi:MAG TPA: Bcr/CflA family multidrug efflux MFS transporter [Stellaceae bacterium]|nr:Bcr/CflA family multidrug efflux MFS transporter [Stellaceae bacterium]